jgi:Fe-S cluster assembly protein SufD
MTETERLSEPNSNQAEHFLHHWLATTHCQSTEQAQPWLLDIRQQAAQHASERGLPTQKEEGWRYTGVQKLFAHPFVAASSPSVTAATIEQLQPHLELMSEDVYRVVLIDGYFVAQLSTIASLPAGVSLTSINQCVKEQPAILQAHFDRCAHFSPHQLLSLCNTAAWQDGCVLIIEPDVQLAKPIEIIHIATSQQAALLAQLRHIIQIGAGAHAEMIERYLGFSTQAYATNTLIEIDLAPNAHLKHYRTQLETPNAFHITNLLLNQQQASHYESMNIGLGAQWARTDLNVQLTATQAQCDLRGFYMTGHQQLIDYHVDVTHACPNCSSQEHFKGLAYGAGKAVFDGRVYVAPHAQGTSANMTNHNLMLSPDAEIDTKPQLEIYADDVQCSHGTTIGQLDREMVFYLRSRGLPLATARQLLCLGFAENMLEYLEPLWLREQISAQIANQLEHATF